MLLTEEVVVVSSLTEYFLGFDVMKVTDAQFLFLKVIRKKSCLNFN